ncbi:MULTISPECIES: SDR family NAD(P)-dependent oxidoreductase [unclassified Sphingomonas]|uniref:SDR family NAD(P)-dependent oxidoreductase n=1 Tax=unclassified Sphingomonas TaxID=196159 RepID=UPI000926F383|nr:MULTISPECIES: SDR family NAD(P)-dependent oxidoreductase [unclassified Sphingomonas]MBN8847027.1 SDR family oxidoreductase [Sphingomonas sp.]OJV33126.1 MAG: 3-oxoacyl-ACP reductase [Sphingomonas sp. 67-36]
MIHILATGTSRGIGAAIMSALDRPGVRIAGHGTASGIAADLSDPAAPARLWEAALEQLGAIDVLINNAGIYEANPIDRDESDWNAAWERTMRINLTAAAALSRLAVRHWRARRQGGRIINIASRAAHRGDSADHWDYAASKAGMVAMTKTIARHYAAEEILAFAICPGFVDTDMAADHLGPALLDEIPLGRVAMPGEVAEMARWLALDAPASMTGAVLDVNGASYVR